MEDRGRRIGPYSKIGKGQLFNLITKGIIYMPRTILGS